MNATDQKLFDTLAERVAALEAALDELRGLDAIKRAFAMRDLSREQEARFQRDAQANAQRREEDRRSAPARVRVDVAGIQRFEGKRVVDGRVRSWAIDTNPRAQTGEPWLTFDASEWAGIVAQQPHVADAIARGTLVVTGAPQ